MPGCGFCHRGEEAEEVCGRLFHSNTANCTAHKKCMQYSALLVQYKFDSFGGFKIGKVQDEVQRGNRLKCFLCKGKKGAVSKGASSGCAWSKCSKSFHFYCANIDKKAVTRRIEVVNKETKNKLVMYRVFCSEDHLNKFAQKEYNDINYVSDSDDDDDDNVSLPPVNLSQSSKESDSNSDTSGSVDSSDCTDDDFTKDIKRLYTEKKKKKRASSQGAKKKPLKDNSTSSSEDEDAEDSKTLPDIGKFAKATNKENNVKPNGAQNGKTPTTSSGGPKRGKRPSTGKALQVKMAFPRTPNKASPEAGKTKAGLKQQLFKGDYSDTAASDEDHAPQAAAAGGDGDFVVRARKAEENEYVLSFLASGQLTKETKCELKWLGEKVTGVAADHVFIWPHVSKLSYEMMMYFLRHLTTVLREGDSPEVERLIFHLSPSDLESYQNYLIFNKELGPELEGKIYDKLPVTIMENLVASEERFGESVGNLYKWKGSLTQSYVLFLIISDTIDLTRTMRSRLGSKRKLVQWKPSSRVLENYNLTAEQRDTFKVYEVKSMRHWLGTKLETMELHSLPMEEILQSVKTSVTRQLWDHFSSTVESTADGPALIFFLPVDPDIVTYHRYVHKCILGLLAEQLTACRDMYCVLDIGGRHLSTWSEIVGKLPPHVSVTVWSVMDPEKQPVSSVILQFSMQTDNKPEQADDVKRQLKGKHFSGSSSEEVQVTSGPAVEKYCADSTQTNSVKSAATKHRVDSDSSDAKKHREVRPLLKKLVLDSSVVKNKSDSPAVKKQTDSPSVKKSTDSPALNKSTDSPAVKKSTDSPAAKKSTDSPSVKKSTDSPAVKKSTDSPAAKKSTDSTAVKKSTDSPSVKKSTDSPAVKKSTDSPSVKKSTDSPAGKKQTDSPAVKKQTDSPAVRKRRADSPPQNNDDNSDSDTSSVPVRQNRSSSRIKKTLTEAASPSRTLRDSPARSAKTKTASPGKRAREADSSDSGEDFQKLNPPKASTSTGGVTRSPRKCKKLKLKRSATGRVSDSGSEN